MEKCNYRTGTKLPFFESENNVNEYNNQSVEFTKGNIKNRINNLDF